MKRRPMCKRWRALVIERLRAKTVRRLREEREQMAAYSRRVRVIKSWRSIPHGPEAYRDM